VNTAIVVLATDVTITASYKGTTRNANLHVTNALGCSGAQAEERMTSMGRFS